MPDSLGDILAQTRRALGKSLAEAESVTRIRAKLLEALEHGDYDALPNPAYVRGYIISYAKFLGLDPSPLLDLFAKETAQLGGHTPLKLPDQVVPARNTILVVPPRTLVALTAITVVAAVAVWGIGRALRGSEAIPPAPTVPTTTQTIEPTETIPWPVETTTLPEQPTSVQPTMSFLLRVDVLPSGASWLRVTIDGLKAYEGTLAGGQSKEWEVTDFAAIRVGKPSVVRITRDGKPVEIPRNDETPEVTISVEDEVP